jgi:hypothetical protein
MFVVRIIRIASRFGRLSLPHEWDYFSPLKRKIGTARGIAPECFGSYEFDIQTQFSAQRTIPQLMKLWFE